MPEINVTKYYHIDSTLLVNTHAREGEWIGPKVALLLMYDSYPLELTIRRDEIGNWEAANVFHGNYTLICPFCKEKSEGSCREAAAYMDQLAEDVLNHPSFRLIALFEL